MRHEKTKHQSLRETQAGSLRAPYTLCREFHYESSFLHLDPIQTVV